MKIGVPKEIKNNENRVGLTPEAAASLVENGHSVFIESSSGSGIGFFDHDYKNVGCKILACARALYENSDCLLYTSPSPRDATLSRMPSSA